MGGDGRIRPRSTSHRHGPPFNQQPEPPEHPGNGSAWDAGCAPASLHPRAKSSFHGLSAIELVVLAHLSRATTLLAALPRRRGLRPHGIASPPPLFDAPAFRDHPGSALQRQQDHQLLADLAWACRSWQELKIPLSEAKVFMARYFGTAAGAQELYENVEEMAWE